MELQSLIVANKSGKCLQCCLQGMPAENQGTAMVPMSLHPQFEDGASISPLVSFGVLGKPNSNNNKDVGPLIFHAGRGCADDPTGR